jgi:protein subunit release factor B
MLQNPDHLLKAIEILRSLQYFDLTSEAGERWPSTTPKNSTISICHSDTSDVDRCQTVLSHLHDFEEQRNVRAKQLQELEAERDLADRKRKTLESAKLQEIRDFKLKNKMEKLLPGFNLKSNHERQLVNLVQKMVDAAADAMKSFEVIFL